MKILDRLPIPAADTLAFVDSESVRLKKDEIIVWVSLTDATDTQYHPSLRRFPAVLDTGHTHNFAIQQQHLIRWAGIQLATLRFVGHLRHAGKRIPLRAAKLLLHRNQPGKTAIGSYEPRPLPLLRGIAVFPDGDAYPRLPLVGMRAILSNHLHVTIDGQHASVTLRTPDWRTRLLRLLA